LQRGEVETGQCCGLKILHRQTRCFSEQFQYTLLFAECTSIYRGSEIQEPVLSSKWLFLNFERSNASMKM
jgi:hypothetical protein